MEQPDPVRPAYGQASLADVLPSVLAVLGVPGAVDRLRLVPGLAEVRRIAVLLVDGLGYQQLPVAAPLAPTLADAYAGRLGDLRAITAVFPSTTPVSLTSVGTGVAPGAHGVVGFTVRVPGTGQLLTHIYWGSEPDPLRWQPVTTQFALARDAGVAVTVVNRPDFAGTGLTAAAYRGANYVAADGAEQVTAEMLAALRRGEAPTLVYGYLPDVDTAGHRWGVDSPPWRAAAATVDRTVSRLVDGLPGDAALLVTADHGQVDVPVGCRFDLDADPRLSTGVATVAGEPRVRYLHTVPGARDDVLEAWRAVLGDAARVTTGEQLIEEGWFGQVADGHRERIGDVVVACRDRYAVMATSRDPEVVSRLVAFHGSFTAAEMRVPLLILRPVGPGG